MPATTWKARTLNFAPQTPLAYAKTLAMVEPSSLGLGATVRP